jgi:hypothetical protein
LLLFAANHTEYYFRSERLKKRDPADIAVRVESQAISGHATIGIEESGKDKNAAFLRFAALSEWSCDPKSPSKCPPQIQKLSGKNFSCLGFMYPLEPGSVIKNFCLMRSTQTCCYGPRPQYNQYIFTEMREPVKFERLAPVLVTGRFVVDPQPSQGFIYRMEAVSAAPAEGDTADVSPEEEAAKSGLPLFDFSPLRAAFDNPSAGLPAALAALDGKEALAAGYFFERTLSPAPQLLAARDYWDGVSKGTPPDPGNAVLALLKDASQMPPVWKDKGVLRGVLHVEKDPKLWSKNGIVSLRDAVWTGKKRGLSVLSGPVLSLWEEAALLGVFLWGALSAGGKPRSQTTEKSKE